MGVHYLKICDVFSTYPKVCDSSSFVEQVHYFGVSMDGSINQWSVQLAVRTVRVSTRLKTIGSLSTTGYYANYFRKCSYQLNLN